LHPSQVDAFSAQFVAVEDALQRAQSERFVFMAQAKAAAGERHTDKQALERAVAALKAAELDRLEAHGARAEKLSTVASAIPHLRSQCQGLRAEAAVGFKDMSSCLQEVALTLQGIMVAKIASLPIRICGEETIQRSLRAEIAELKDKLNRSDAEHAMEINELRLK
jgi:hypothetical protein